MLQPTLCEPIPDALVGYLTVDVLPSHIPALEPEIDHLGRYCQEITQLLMSGTLTPAAETVMGDLLHELVGYFADTLKAPRWLRTDQGCISIS